MHDRHLKISQRNVARTIWRNGTFLFRDHSSFARDILDRGVVNNVSVAFEIYKNSCDISANLSSCRYPSCNLLIVIWNIACFNIG